MLDHDVTNIVREEQETQGPPAGNIPALPTAYQLAQQLQKTVKELALMPPETNVYVRIEVHKMNRYTAVELTSKFDPSVKPKAGLFGSTLWLVSDADPGISLTAFLE